MRIAIYFLCCLFAGCDEATTASAQRCDVFLYTLTPDSAEPGESVVAQAQPVTETWDTIIQVGANQAQVNAISRTDCAECDSCRSKENCTACDTCDACDDQCRDICIETVQFTVPASAPGPQSVSMMNQHGHSASLPFTVLGSEDTGGVDTGPSEPGESPGDSGDASSR